ncbi:Gfo/Idh/MocA family oxidoreductase [Paenibacillus sp.]|uniref:Gfo/Idh/MocA family protein n=1 Tax=Paenibacillus sp. TaxID=58172 RepID=UPI002811949E|nr:Gfo/Idh/MocA family oxidoreductase [Paenibacillus sp.]
MRAGILSFAHMHAHSYAAQLRRHPDAELAAVWDADETRGREAAATYGAEYVADLSAFLSLPIEAVIVCSETAKHKEHVVAVARAKKHVLCEKPIATTTADAEEMIRACREEGVTLRIAFPVRHATAARIARERIQAGELGRVLAVRSSNRGKRPGGWFEDPALSGGGAAADHTVHLTDAIRWMLGDEVRRVFAELETSFRDQGAVEDCGVALLEMRSGTIVSIDPSWSMPDAYPIWGDLTMEIVGERGTITLDLFRQSSRWYAAGSANTTLLPWMDDLNEGLIREFVEGVRDGRPPEIAGEDGLRTLEVVEACYLSRKAGHFIELTK